MQAKIYQFDGQKESTKTLPKEIFGAKENKTLLAEAVRVYLANQRKAHPKVKSRGEVSGSGRKIWRQKGTGRARHGDRYANIFVGGGVAHGPTGKENWKLTLPKKKKNEALKVALSQKWKDKELIFVDDFSKVGLKTKQAEQSLKELLKSQAKTSLVFGGENSRAVLPFRNLPWVRIVKVGQLNPYLVLDNKFLVFDQEALEKLTQRLKC